MRRRQLILFMAQPIPFELPRRDPRDALYERLKSAPHEHAEALLNVYEILQELQNRGILDLAKGALGSSEEVLRILVNVANKPEMIRGIRNVMILANIANAFEPELLEGLEQAVKEGLAEAQKPKPVGLWEVVQKLFSQESRRVLIATASILEAVGKSLGE
jgi:uncharacterized protein YjgD (DUF1641 family)